MAENTIKINVEVDDKPVKSLKAELRETIDQLQRTELGTEAFDKLNQKAAELKDKMAEVNEQVAVFATGSKYEQVSNSLGEIGAGLRDLDFDRVTNGAKLFAKTSKSITFKDAIGSLKQMGSAFVSIGKAILTNPLFLIVAVVGAIIGAIIALLDELGILKIILRQLVMLLDGLSNNSKTF
jgi:predicted phage tail protein